METSIMVSEDGKYIVLVIRGAIQGDPKILIQPMIELNELARTLGTKRCLVDATNATNVQSVFDDFAIVNWTTAKEPAIDRRMQIALLVSPEDHSHDFIETVSKNAGYNFRLFREQERAIEYLGRDRA